MPRKSPLLALFLSFFLLAAACGSDDTTDVTTAVDGDAQAQPDDVNSEGGDDPIPVEPDGGIGDGAEPLPVDDGGDDPIPVEPDGGIGDGAEPLPGAQEPSETGTWHGAQVAETNCPGIAWKRVEASAFSFSVPVDFVESDVQPIDSEVGIWTGANQIEVVYDYGWYSGEISGTPGAENEVIDYSGITGEQTILRDGSTNLVGVFFGEVNIADGQADRLSLVVNFDDASDEIIGRCIVGSIEWTA